MTRVFIPPSLRGFEPRRMLPGPISRYLPLEYDLAWALRPTLVADAGTGAGISFYAYCQAMKDHDVDGTAYAYDIWDGQEGAHPDATYDSVNAHGRKHYPGHHYVVRLPPMEAMVHFSEGTLDLLRLDGARPELVDPRVSEEWFRRIRPGGVLALHGTARGAAPLYHRLAAMGDAVHFADGNGLGLVQKAGGAPNDAELLRLLFDEKQGQALDELYAHARRFHQLKKLFGAAPAKAAEGG